MDKWKASSSIDPNDEHRDWRLIESLVGDVLQEQKRARKWGIFFKSLTFIYLFVVLILFLPGAGIKPGPDAGQPHTALVKIEGVIAADQTASANAVVTGLRAAFESEQAKAVIVAINSPGGSPVQAGYIYDEIARLRELHPAKTVYAVIGDLGASGGYYVAAAADQIYADKASLVGSIGVTASGFGFVDSLEKLGVERRHFTAGDHKAFLDPFSPLKESERMFWQQVLDNTHQQFIEVVKRGRGDRLQVQDDMFSGLIWNGEQALELGLIDGLGSAGFVAREVIGEEAVVDYTYRRSPLESLIGNLGMSIGRGVGQALGLSSQPLQLR
ncbi:S49 family peptidase [Exilibacterium tricleocarpae]|uniref:S49 family peptidase n=1 Tax=Exilibacterium tricleocarpae TaxID=2591008 RepID=A0A545T8E4_9GAMM|nr:S49 family peptidase [Exilibacterium tricleocarpae]TQV73481.1 S49 family peptidase [Exilibacterium tricleocarpae]